MVVLGIALAILLMLRIPNPKHNSEIIKYDNKTWKIVVIEDHEFLVTRNSHNDEIYIHRPKCTYCKNNNIIK